MFYTYSFLPLERRYLQKSVFSSYTSAFLFCCISEYVYQYSISIQLNSLLILIIQNKKHINERMVLFPNLHFAHLTSGNHPIFDLSQTVPFSVHWRVVKIRFKSNMGFFGNLKGGHFSLTCGWFFFDLT